MKIVLVLGLAVALTGCQTLKELTPEQKAEYACKGVAFANAQFNKFAASVGASASQIEVEQAVYSPIRTACSTPGKYTVDQIVTMVDEAITAIGKLRAELAR